jgi:L-threonylcarbamoyladenylate synthase
MFVSVVHLHRALCCLRSGGLLAYPTEGVWGLGCDPHNLSAVLALLALKNRPLEKGLILVAADEQQLAPYLEHLSPQQRRTLSTTWPGPHTWLVPCNRQVPPWISGGQPTVALRVSRHPVVAALCQAYGGPIVSTSANVTGQRPAISWLDLQKFLRAKRKQVVVLPGPLTHPGKPSTIQDLLTHKLVRN